MIDLVAEVRADIARDIAKLKARHTCSECGDPNFMRGFALRYGVFICLDCYPAWKQAVRQEEADDRRNDE